jgi:SAM-dependent methyltransferase
MNPGLPDDHASVRFYDGDYPWQHDRRAPSNFDDVVAFQGLAHDVDLYLDVANDAGGPILDACCGTGRVTVPLARAGHRTVGVDISAGQLAQLRTNLALEEAVRRRIEAVEADVTNLDLGRKFELAIMAFNSLCCITSPDGQLAALRHLAAHLAPGGQLVLDLVNPLKLPLLGDAVPKPFFTRTNPATGRRYTRFAMSDAFDENNRQRLHGWYDELLEGDVVKRSFYSMHWRPIFLPELQLMLMLSGLRARHIYGGHQREAFTAQSAKLVVFAERAE